MQPIASNGSEKTAKFLIGFRSVKSATIDDSGVASAISQPRQSFSSGDDIHPARLSNVGFSRFGLVATLSGTREKLVKLKFLQEFLARMLPVALSV
tara:strand:- start:5574 stop:5861 length:288 start_codon:yes stop_codon:yes gene_type:complete